LQLRLSSGAEAGDPHTVRSALGWGVQVPGISGWIQLLLAICVSGFSVFGLAVHGASAWVPLGDGLFSWWVFVGMFFATIWVHEALDAMLLTATLKCTTPILRISAFGPKVESAAWAVVDQTTPVVASMLIPVSTALLALSGWLPGWVSAGVLLSSFLVFTVRACPLIHGPVSVAFSRISHSEDWPGTLRLAIAARFLPLGQAIVSKGGWIVALGGLSTFVWAYGVTAALEFLSDLVPLSGFTSILWTMSLNVLQAIWVLWTLWVLANIFRNALRLRGKGQVVTFSPSPEMAQAWKTHCAMILHVPELGDLPWVWRRISPGSFLIRYGELDRTFHWIESGAAQVLGRNSNGDVVHWATVRDGSAVGEIALLEGKPRTADVLTTQDVVSASLDAKEAEVLSESARARLKDFVLVAQAFDRCSVLTGMTHANKEHWLAHGMPRHFVAGEVVIHEGDPERWMALLVKGKLRIEKTGKVLATLGPDSVIGEMAFLATGSRKATVTAEEDCLCWRWEAEWLQGEVMQAGLLQVLADLANQRARAF
jgi:CRP-like cAMP-binding protein